MAVNKHHDESLRLLIQKTRETSLTLLKDVSAEQARWLPIGEVNSILWHAGHVFVVVERCIFAAVAGSEDIPPSIPGGWWAVFGWNSKPWEIDPEQPRQGNASVKSRLRHYTNLEKMAGKLTELVHEFHWGRMDSLASREAALAVELAA